MLRHCLQGAGAVAGDGGVDGDGDGDGDGELLVGFDRVDQDLVG